MKKLFCFLFISIQVISSHAQNVGIGTTNPHASAQLQVSSTTRGFLPPRMTGTQRGAIASPMNGLVVYDTDAERLYCYMNGTWQQIVDGGMWLRTGGSNRKQVINFTDSIVIGSFNGNARLSVTGDVEFNSSQFRMISSDMNISNGGIIMNTTNGTFELQAGGVSKGFVQLSGDNLRVGTFSSNTNGQFIVRVAGADRLLVDELGRVGIGNNSPTEKLDVTGNINFSGKITSDATGSAPLNPICWGQLTDLNGGMARSTGNVSATHMATGRYRITCPQITVNTVVILSNGATGVTLAWNYISPGVIEVYVRKAAISVNSTIIYEDLDNGFSFIMY